MDKKKRQIFFRVSILILLAALALVINKYGTTSQDKEQNANTLQSGLVEVHFIDVGQGDSILVETEKSAMLIDAGENYKGPIVADYLRAQGISKLDYVIGTHPHGDHIGGLDTIINTFPVENVIMPDITHTTEAFDDLLSALEYKKLSITKSVVGTEYSLGPAVFTILAPNSSSYEDMNNYSIVIKLTYGDTSFLFTGDASKLSEEEMLADGMDLTADVLKLGHHGSTSSTTDKFLDAVNPEYAVVSVGADNEYGHPSPETLKKIIDRHIKLYRTDKQGTVVFTSDGSTISVNAQEYDLTESE